MTICDEAHEHRAGAGTRDGSAAQRTETIVQQLYATGLSLQMCLDGANTPNQRQRLELAIDVLDELISELGSLPLDDQPDH